MMKLDTIGTGLAKPLNLQFLEKYDQFKSLWMSSESYLHPNFVLNMVTSMTCLYKEDRRRISNTQHCLLLGFIICNTDLTCWEEDHISCIWISDLVILFCLTFACSGLGY